MEHKEEYIMEKKSIRMIAAVAAAAMLVPLAACGGGNAADGKTTLSFFSNNPQDKYQPIIDAFEKANPDIKIDYSTTTGSQSGYQQTLQTRISGGNLADVYIVPPEALSDLVKGNYAKDLSNESFMDKIGDAAKKAYSVDGKVYAMGVSAWTNAWVYNKDLLKKVGYDSIPATWDEFLTMCGKLKAAGITPYLEPKDGLGNAVEGWIGAESAKQGEALDAKIDAGKDTFKNVYGKYYGEWDKLIKQNLMSSDVSGLSGDQVKSEFTAGRLAVYPSGSWDIDSFNETGLNYGFGQIPMLKKGDTPYAPGSIDPAFGINNKISGDKLKAAEKFFTFLTSDEGLKLYQKQLGLIPSVKGFNATVDDHFKDAYDLYIKTGNVYLNSAHWSKGTTALRAETFTQLQQVALGSISPTQAAENLDSKLKTLS